MKNLLLALAVFAGVSVCGNSPIHTPDSLKGGLQHSRGEKRVTILTSLAEVYMRLDFEQSLKYADSACNESGDREKEFCHAGLYKAVALMNLGLLDSASSFSTILIDLDPQDKTILAKLYNVRGLTSMKRNQYQQALGDFLQSQRIAESIGDQLLTAKALTNAGLTYLELNQVQRAKDYFLRTLPVFSGKDLNNEALVCSNLAICYGKLHILDSVRIYGERSLNLTRITGDVYTGANVSNILSLYYQNTGDWDKAEQLLIEAKKLRENIQDPYFLVADQITLAEFYLQKKDWKNAEKNALMALDKARELAVTGKFENLFQLLGNIYSATGNYEKSSHYYQMWAIEKDSNYSNASTRAMAEMQAKYETEKQEKENLRLLSEKQEAEVWIFSLATLCLFIVLVSFIFINTQRNKRKSEKQQNEKDRFRALIDGTEKERERIARDLHDGLGQLLINTRMQVVLALEKNGEEQVDPAQLLDEAIDEVRNISHDLMPGSLSRLGLAASLHDLQQKINSAGQIRMSLEHPAEMNYSPELEKNIYRIIQETTANMIRHSGGDGISVKIKEEGQGLEIAISDNGHGFDVSKIDHFSGLGWKNIQTRVNVIRGKLTIQSSPDHGTKVIIILPVHSV